MIRLMLAGALLFGSLELAAAQTTLRVGDQKGNAQAVMEAAGVLKNVPYKIEWKEFPAAAPLLEALSAGAIETGLVGDAPFIPRGCIAQAWSVAEILRAWTTIDHGSF